MSEEWHKTHAVLRERCEYVFDYTGNRCQLEKGHPAGEHKWYASHENEAILMRQQNAQPEMTSLRDIRQKLEALVEMRADDERARKLILEGQERQWLKILDFEKNCADAIRILGDRKIAALEGKLDNLHGIAEHNAMEQSAKLDGIRDGLASELAELRKEL